MAHPKDKPGISRRQFARGAAGAVAGAGVAAGLAACENTTTPVGAEAAGATGASADLVVPKPTNLFHQIKRQLLRRSTVILDQQ